jgi:uncharacterized protein YjbI with pentapeptide repeats
MKNYIATNIANKVFDSPCEGMDISRSFAHYVRFQNCVCNGMMARQAELRGSIWKNVTAPYTRFTMSDVSGALFEKCDFMNTDWAGVFAKGAIFYRCDLVGANFEGADLEGACYIQCDLTQAQLKRAILCNAVFQENKMELTDFYLAELKDIRLGRNEMTNVIGLVSDLEILKSMEGRIYAYRFQQGDQSPFHGVNYTAGDVYTVDTLSYDKAIGCAPGLHMATLDWCIACGIEEIGLDEKGIPKFDIWQVSCDPVDIVVPYERGRFRASKIRFERKLALLEWWREEDKNGSCYTDKDKGQAYIRKTTD